MIFKVYVYIVTLNILIFYLIYMIAKIFDASIQQLLFVFALASQCYRKMLTSCTVNRIHYTFIQLKHA